MNSPCQYSIDPATTRRIKPLRSINDVCRLLRHARMRHGIEFELRKWYGVELPLCEWCDVWIHWDQALHRCYIEPFTRQRKCHHNCYADLGIPRTAYMAINQSLMLRSDSRLRDRIIMACIE